VREASELLSDDLLENVAVEREIRDDLLQLPILVAQRSQLAELLDAQSRKLFLPAIERLLADPEPATDFGDLLAAVDLMQSVDDLFVTGPLRGIAASPSGRPRRPV
jgi:hypothetical protein